MDDKTQKLFKQLRLEVKRANQRLVRLERAFGKDKWGAKTLKGMLETDTLNAWTSTGRVTIRKRNGL